MKRLGQGPIEADVKALRVLLGKCGLAQPGGWLPFVTYGGVAGITTSPAYPVAATISRAMIVRAWYQTAFVATTNNGSNYWTLSLVRTSDSATIATLNTSAMSASTWTLLSSTDLDLALTTSHKGVYITATKTGSPGALSMYGPAVFVT